jgi:hypothetical protein
MLRSDTPTAAQPVDVTDADCILADRAHCRFVLGARSLIIHGRGKSTTFKDRSFFNPTVLSERRKATVIDTLLR